MRLQEVDASRYVKEFLRLPVRLYKDELNWIRPLDKDIETVFDPKQNKYFRHGTCQRWILIDDQEKTIGRVAAFIDKKTANKHDQPTGGMGFFECINDQDAANMLFQACQIWLKERGMEAMDGPINFGDRDRWWGLLIDGFYPPNYGMDYHMPYYKSLFETFGFQLYFKQFTYRRPAGGSVPLDEKMNKRAEKFLSDPDYSFRHLTKNDIAQAPEWLRTVYNKAWARHSGVKEMSLLQAKNTLKQMKPVIDYRLLWFGFYKEDPIAFFISIPELNQIFKHLNGKMNLLGKLKFVYYKWRKACNKALGLVFGVVPEFQAKGVESALIVAWTKVGWEPDFEYETMEMNWIGDFNPKMMRVAEQVGATIYKTHGTYRFLFDRSKTFQRLPIIG